MGPFRQIEGFTNIILSSHSEFFDEKTTRHFQHILNGSKSGAAIIEALLRHSKLITKDFNKTEFDCNAVFEQVHTQLSTMLESSKASICYQNIPVIVGDRDLIYQLFYELIHNALLYQAPDNNPAIRIQVKEDSELWEFCIQDNGIGFRSSASERIFIALRRAVSQKIYPGIGMGLTTAKTIVQRHGGSIWATTEESIGSKFYFTLRKSTTCDRD